MKLIILPFLSLCLGSLAQSTKKITNTSGDKYNKEKEIFYVLTTNETVKEGPYEYYWTNSLECTGFYKAGKKDSVWIRYRRGKVASKRFYQEGKRTGIWEFFKLNGEPDWKYDFNTQTSIHDQDYKEPNGLRTLYLNESNEWVVDALAMRPLRLTSDGEWLGYLISHLRYPQEAIDKNQTGTTNVRLEIDETGLVIGYEIETSSYPSLDAEALRIIKAFPFEFIPAEKDGRKIRSKILQPMVFKLEGG